MKKVFTNKLTREAALETKHSINTLEQTDLERETHFDHKPKINVNIKVNSAV